jgi:DNA uptake protein ComE-like DNA-binding protein
MVQVAPRYLLLFAAATIAACKPQRSADYLAWCQGEPLYTIERREKAMTEGYEIHPAYDCITKRSAKAMADQEAAVEAANTPEAKAARAAQRERKIAEEKVEREAHEKAFAEAKAAREQRWAAEEAAPVVPVEINSASESQLAAIKGLGSHVVQEILAERAKGRFAGWEDVVHRVAGLGAAETAVRASAYGLTVNGRPLEGAEPGSVMARFAREKWRRNHETGISGPT